MVQTPSQPLTLESLLLANLLHCLKNGTELGWLLDPESETVLAIFPESRVKLYQGTELLPTLQDVDLTLSATAIFD